MTGTSSVPTSATLTSTSSAPRATTLRDGTNERDVTAQDVRDACVSSKTHKAYKECPALTAKSIRATKGECALQYFHLNAKIDLNHISANDFEDILLENGNVLALEP